MSKVCENLLIVYLVIEISRFVFSAWNFIRWEGSRSESDIWIENEEGCDKISGKEDKEDEE